MRLDPLVLCQNEDEYMKDDRFRIAMAALSRRSLSSVSYNPTERLGEWMTKIVKCEPDMRDQHSTGTCWLQAACALMDAYALKKGIKINFSATYLSYYDKLEKSNVFLQRHPRNRREEWHLYNQDGPLTDGGTWNMFVYLACKYGLAPMDAYPRTHQAKYTSQINKCIRHTLREAKYAERAPERVLYDVQNALARAYTPPPRTIHLTVDEHGIEWKGTPLELFRWLVPEEVTQAVLLTHAPDRPVHRWYASLTSNDASTTMQDPFFTVSMDTLQTACTCSIDADIPVWFTADVSTRRDTESAHMGFQVRDPQMVLGLTRLVANEEAKRVRMLTLDTMPEHAMLITGYRRDRGCITAWRVQNSWGDEFADGYLTMTDEWFKNFVFTIAVAPRFLDLSTRLAMRAETHVQQLPPWDIFSTVARVGGRGGKIENL